MLEDFNKVIGGTIIAAFATVVGWVIKKVVGMDAKFATKQELAELSKNVKEDMKGVEDKMEDLREMVTELAVLPAVLARVEREIGTSETGLRGAVHRLTDQFGGVLRKIQSDLEEIKKLKEG